MIITEKDIKGILSQLKNIESSDGGGIYEVFKQKIKDIFKVDNVLLTNNGTASLYLSFKAIGLKEGDEVVTGNYTYHSTNTTLLNFTKNIKFCDYDENLVISVDEINKHVGKDTKLLIIPHTWGLAPDMYKIVSLKKKYKDLVILEDCSQAHFAKYDGKYLGTFGDIGAFSMQGGKILISGEGGFTLINNRALYEKMLINSDCGKNIENILGSKSMYEKYFDTGLGLMKFRPNPLGIALANTQIDSIFEIIKIKQYFANYIKKELCEIGFIKFPEIHELEMSYYGLVGMYHETLNNNMGIDDFLKMIREKGIKEIYNPQNNKPSNLLNLFIDIFGNREYKMSERIYGNLLLFKISGNINDKSSIENYIKLFKKICKK